MKKQPRNFLMMRKNLRILKRKIRPGGCFDNPENSKFGIINLNIIFYA